MSTLPPGNKSIGPIYIPVDVKEQFLTVCKSENKTMNDKLKELVDMAIGKKPWPVIVPAEISHAPQ
jgi:hypothetical protein